MSNDIEILAIRPVQLYDRDRGFYKVKEAEFRVGNTVHTFQVSMSDFDAGRLPELVKAEADKIKNAIGRLK